MSRRITLYFKIARNPEEERRRRRRKRGCSLGKVGESCLSLFIASVIVKRTVSCLNEKYSIGSTTDFLFTWAVAGTTFSIIHSLALYLCVWLSVCACVSVPRQNCYLFFPLNNGSNAMWRVAHTYCHTVLGNKPLNWDLSSLKSISVHL